MTEVYVASAFTKDGKGGNKAGVVLQRKDLTAEQKKDIAKILGFSETAFVTDSDAADYRLEYFTPTGEVPLCGHATVAVFTVLQALNMLHKPEYTIETKAGRLQIRIKPDVSIFMEQNTPAYGEIFLPEQLADVFDAAAFSASLPIRSVSTGLWDVLLPIASAEKLSDLKPDFEKLAEFNRQTQTVGVHAFALCDSVDAVCRDFAPLYGIPEESATGTASCALACYLFRYGQQKTQYVFEQGYELGAPSRIAVELQTQEDRIVGVFVGGYGCLTEKRSLAAVPSAEENRIAAMEQCYDTLRSAAEDLRNFEENDSLQVMLRRLADYYESGLWLEDYQRDEQGALPQDLKRGVLSQDGVYNLLAELQPYFRKTC